jgi:hypothetical protein
VTSEEIGRLTIAEVEAITDRATSALRAFQEAQRLLGAVAPGVVVAEPPPRQTQGPSPEQQRYLDQMRGSAERQRLLEQFHQPEEQ